MNQKTMPTSSNNDWLQYYNQAMSPVEKQPSTTEGAPAKPIRKRSRASKTMPTTLLNANANNFRALVQQFTGCHSADAFCLANRKGPVNLNFGLRNATPIIEPPRNHSDYDGHYSQPLPKLQQQQQSNYLQNNIMGQDLQQYSSMNTSSSLNTRMSNIDNQASDNNITMEISNGFVMDDHDLSIGDYAPPTEYYMEI